MLNKVLGGLVGFVAGLFVLGYVLPDRAQLHREIVVHAPADEVFALISDLGAWESWSPWQDNGLQSSPTLTANHALGIDGVGQRIRLRTEAPQIGGGVQEIVAIAAPGHVVTRLDLGVMGEADAAFSLTPLANGSTKVVWTYHANMREQVPVYLQPISTYMGYIVDPMLGPSYERGLQNLKRVAEGS